MSTIKLALPAGDLRAESGRLLLGAGIDVSEYAEGSRLYHFRLEQPDVRVRVFREKDVPIQIALGNYALGICGGVWIAEAHARYPNDDVVPLRPFGFGVRRVYAAAHGDPAQALRFRPVRIVSEYPNLAERYALAMRFPDYRVMPVHGAAEAYPPEDAEIALLDAADEATVEALGLRPLQRVYEGGAWLVANRRALEGSDLSPLLRPLLAIAPPFRDEPGLSLPSRRNAGASVPRPDNRRDVVRLAVPDGHQQRHAHASLTSAGLTFDGYSDSTWVRRPTSAIDGLEVKVIRPQDMPQQVALGNYDLALTGRDWLADHLYAFPGSPVREAVDLGRSRYSLAAVVPDGLPADTIDGALALWGDREIRVASEYANTADHYARLRRIRRYRVIPINGASEGFVPEDADILIEGTETGTTLRANRLKAIDSFFLSTNCLIRSTRPVEGRRAALIEDIVSRLRAAAVTAPPFQANLQGRVADSGY
ncbi:MAG: ATP phosphoribosyltransferase [Dehalococcoidia bacterium]|nr:ATP phosphoribosyltransferase [Dehalococcoidia bacterium]